MGNFYVDNLIQNVSKPSSIVSIKISKSTILIADVSKMGTEAVPERAQSDHIRFVSSIAQLDDTARQENNW